LLLLSISATPHYENGERYVEKVYTIKFKVPDWDAHVLDQGRHQRAPLGQNESATSASYRAPGRQVVPILDPHTQSPVTEPVLLRDGVPLWFGITPGNALPPPAFLHFWRYAAFDFGQLNLPDCTD